MGGGKAAPKRPHLGEAPQTKLDLRRLFRFDPCMNSKTHFIGELRPPYNKFWHALPVSAILHVHTKT
jgi:hypothetical protein